MPCALTFYFNLRYSADFQFEEFRGRLDGKGLAVAEHQEKSISSRKRLAEITKGSSPLLAPVLALTQAPQNLYSRMRS